MYMQIETYCLNYVHEGLAYEKHAVQNTVVSQSFLHVNGISSQSVGTLLEVHEVVKTGYKVV